MRRGAVNQQPPAKPERAFTVRELLLIVASLMILAAIFLPALSRSRYTSSRLGCSNNLKQVGLAFQTWGIDNNDRFPMQESVTDGGSRELVASGQVFPHFQVMSNELSTPKILVCPNDQARTYATNFTIGLSDKNISYFVNLDSVLRKNSRLLCGDRNLTNNRAPGSRFIIVSNGISLGWTKELHSKKGNLCFSDGSVHGVTNGWLLATVKLPEGLTNRLAIPQPLPSS
jgi:competence protein ComGC